MTYSTLQASYGKVAEGETALDKISKSAEKLAKLLKRLWKPFQDAWKKEGKNTISAAQIALSGIAKLAISKVNGVVSAIESAFSFGPWKVPTPFGSKTIGFKATFPRVPTVPYLAKGAVIPPRSEFLAVLGDQKQGNNIETPEALLRKIVREETAGRQTGGGSYRFTAQINRRTLFDEMMKEAQMRRDTSGRNPFEMA